MIRSGRDHILNRSCDAVYWNNHYGPHSENSFARTNHPCSFMKEVMSQDRWVVFLKWLFFCCLSTHQNIFIYTLFNILHIYQHSSSSWNTLYSLFFFDHKKHTHHTGGAISTAAAPVKFLLDTVLVIIADIDAAPVQLSSLVILKALGTADKFSKKFFSLLCLIVFSPFGCRYLLTHHFYFFNIVLLFSFK